MGNADGALSIAADFANLATAKTFVCGRAEALAVPDLLESKIELVVEELFLNIVNHARPRIKEEVEIRCARQRLREAPEEMFCIAIRDWGPPFNPLEKEPPSLEQDLDSRPIGGLGVYLVTQMADHCAYARAEESNLFTVCFRLS